MAGNLRKKIMWDIIATIAIILVCIFAFGQKASVLSEMAIYFSVVVFIAVVIGGLFAWGLTRAMNPRRNKK